MIASHGLHELDAIRAALAAGVGHIALVASKTRGAAVLAELDLPVADRDRIRPRPGWAIGARTPQEMAVSIMAEVVAALRTSGLTRSPRPGSRVRARGGNACHGDRPGLRDERGDVRRHTRLVRAGVTVWFCSAGCRDAFSAREAAFEAARDEAE